MPLNQEGLADEKMLHFFFSDYVGEDVCAFLERVGPHALGTKQNTWTFALNAHTPRVVLSLLNIPTTLVETKEVLKTFNLQKTEKEKKPSVRWVKEKYGLEVSDGISDAIMLGEWGRLKTLGLEAT